MLHCTDLGRADLALRHVPPEVDSEVGAPSVRHHGLVRPREPPAGGEAVGQAPVLAGVHDHAALLPLRGAVVARHHDPVLLRDVGPGPRPRQQPPRVPEVGGDVSHLAPAPALVTRDDLEVVHGRDAVVVTVTVWISQSAIKMQNNIVPEVKSMMVVIGCIACLLESNTTVGFPPLAISCPGPVGVGGTGQVTLLHVRPPSSDLNRG